MQEEEEKRIATMKKERKEGKCIDKLNQPTTSD
jgi:hypothetical protein